MVRFDDGRDVGTGEVSSVSVMVLKSEFGRPASSCRSWPVTFVYVSRRYARYCSVVGKSERLRMCMPRIESDSKRMGLVPPTRRTAAEAKKI